MVEVWNWAVGYLLVFAVLQLAVYLYYVRQNEEARSRPLLDGEGYPVGDGDGPTRARTTEGSSAHVGTRPCPHCGAENEPDTTFRYCRECAASLTQI
ncbi:DUF7577 domain-containing protein [Haloarchaeobius sp. DFWS5]|uniref:DUF7577 domain-containing protein n=1 Tax=Haloarchaeobius sp. DFWS5 TaxID=3446114 RepID=UPI003EBF7AD2